MKKLEQWFIEYSRDHQNNINQIIHKIAVPAIVTSLYGLLWCVPTPEWFPAFLNWAVIALGGALLFYLHLSVSLALGMALFGMLQIAFFQWLTVAHTSMWAIMAAIFLGGWLLQFVGHSIEGRRPSFFEDVRFLLIGPLWVLASFYRRVGIRT